MSPVTTTIPSLETLWTYAAREFPEIEHARRGLSKVLSSSETKPEDKIELAEGIALPSPLLLNRLHRQVTNVQGATTAKQDKTLMDILRNIAVIVRSLTNTLKDYLGLKSLENITIYSCQDSGKRNPITLYQGTVRGETRVYSLKTAAGVQFDQQDDLSSGKPAITNVFSGVPNIPQISLVNDINVLAGELLVG